MQITNMEIEHAALILLNDKDCFYDSDNGEKIGERAEAIKSFESKNIVACPGSGKTTTLLAKLIILANKLPFDDGRGICVFTHTNVAIDKIIKELGSKSDILFKYPNFFGTIQSFTNKYLAIPSYISKNGFRPFIDNDKYYAAVKKAYGVSGRLAKYKIWIKNQVIHSQIEPYIFVAHLRFKYGNSNIVAKDLFKESFADVTKDHYQAIRDFKRMIYDYGYMPFDEAYTEGIEYLENDKIRLALRNRFKYVFVDEMQDTGAHQKEILDKLFKDRDDVVYQRYGDPNQAIYNDNRIEGTWSPTMKNSLYISSTMRFSDTIGNSVNNLRVNYHNEPKMIKSSSKKISKNSHLILFDNDEVERVIEKYAEIISQHELVDVDGFYAVGRIVKKPTKGRFSIKSYHPDFEKQSKIENTSYSDLESYLLVGETMGFKKKYKLILNSILYLLDENDIKNLKSNRRFTRTTLKKFIRDNNEEVYYSLKKNVIKWSLSIDSDSDNISAVKEEIYAFYKTLFDKLWKVNIYETNSFFTSRRSLEDNAPFKDKTIKKITIRKPSEEEECVEIKINTINGEKGKTHTATLYLETFKNAYDVEKVIGYMSGDEIKLITQGINKGKVNNNTPFVHLKYAYVGMTRCTDLLCVAVRKSVVTPEIREKLVGHGWTINDDLCA